MSCTGSGLVLAISWSVSTPTARRRRGWQIGVQPYAVVWHIFSGHSVAMILTRTVDNMSAAVHDRRSVFCRWIKAVHIPLYSRVSTLDCRASCRPKRAGGEVPPVTTTLHKTLHVGHCVICGLHKQITTRESKRQPTLAHNFAICWSIFKILSPSDSAVNV